MDRTVKLPSKRHPPASSSEAEGFTLVELLITIAAGLSIIAVLAPVIVSDIRTSLANERFQSSQQAFLRLSSFIDTEVSEGSNLQYAVSTAGCSPSGTSSMTITIPYGFDTSTLLPNQAVVHYFVSGGALYRCGPPILATGALNPTGATATSLLNSNTTITTNAGSDAKGLDYTLEIRNESNQVIFSGNGGSRTRAGIIDN